MTDIVVHKLDAVNIRVQCEAGLAYELAERYTFDVPGAQFSPQVRNGFWDGKIRLFNPMRREIYGGLEADIRQYAERNGYSFESQVPRPKPVTMTELKAFFEQNKYIRDHMQPRDYQWNAVLTAINDERRLLLSPTSSGKSLVIFMILCWYYHHDPDFRALVIVPTVQLVAQMESDFGSYDTGPFPAIHTIMSGREKSSKAPVTISTWQSIYKMDKAFFQPFTVVIGDEAHSFKAKSLTAIMTKLTNAEIRIGTTGTLDGMQTNKITLEGLFGPVHKVTTTAELMDVGHVAKLKIRSLILSYEDADRLFVSRNCKLYKDEVSYIINHEGRNKFLVDLTKSLKGNTLLLFGIVEHGKYLFNHISAGVDTGRKVYLVYGKTDVESREEVRRIVETEENAIIVASYGTFSTGINIKRLHNVIFGHPTKSRIRTLQSIGRGLRLGDDKNEATLYDVADDFRKLGKGKLNHTLRHFVERMRYYDEEGFDVKTFPYKVKSNG